MEGEWRKSINGSGLKNTVCVELKTKKKKKNQRVFVCNLLLFHGRDCALLILQSIAKYLLEILMYYMYAWKSMYMWRNL